MKVKYGKFDSNEEQFFEMWLDELMFHGYIKDYVYQPEPFHLNDPVQFEMIVEMKTKTKIVKRSLLKARKYTPDYKIIWNEKAKNIFYQELNSIKNKRPLFIAQNGISYLDVKGTHNQHSSWGIFEANRKDVWEKHEIFVEKITPIGKKNCLFGLSFTPKLLPIWQKRDNTKMYAWVKWKVKSMEEFVNEQ